MDDYICAGIVPYRCRFARTGRFVTDILLGVEMRVKDDCLVWNYLSGRREDDDKGDPIATAVREFWEESGKWLDDTWCATVSDYLRTIKPVVIDKSVFYLVPIEAIFEANLINAFNKYSDKTVMQQLAWICIDSIDWCFDKKETYAGFRFSYYMFRTWSGLRCAFQPTVGVDA